MYRYKNVVQYCTEYMYVQCMCGTILCICTVYMYVFICIVQSFTEDFYM